MNEPGSTRKAGGLALAFLAIAVAGPIQAQAVARSDSAASTAARPTLHGWREAGLSALGTGLLLSGAFADVRLRPVPAEGYDPFGLDLGLDRGAVGDLHTGASRVSDWTRNAAIAFPFAVSFATSSGGSRTSGLGRTAVVHAEAMLISQGLTLLGKRLLGRPRPYAYVPALSRPVGSSYDVTQDRTFVSMPSGHASSAWAGAAMGLTEYMLNRPEAAWWERAAVGFAGGALAGATSALRVEAGQHFPSDVLAGAGIGVAVGVTLPLLHRGDRRIPPARSWLEMAGGLLAGTFLGTLAAERF
jgi:membrane-associated phospholipid phosphatase